MTVVRITIEETADLIKKDLADRGFEVIDIFPHTGGYTVEVKEVQEDE